MALSADLLGSWRLVSRRDLTADGTPALRILEWERA